MLNHITIMGRLTKDPELRYTNSQIPVTSFRIAVDRDFNRGETDYFNVTAWRHTAEFVGKYFNKGRMAVISGKLQNKQWTDRNGNGHEEIEIVADNVYFGDSKESKSTQGESPQQNYWPVETGPNWEEEDDDGDLPF